MVNLFHINNNKLSYFKKIKIFYQPNMKFLNVDIIIICLPTPLKNNLAIFSFLEKAFHEIKIINKNQVIILESIFILVLQEIYQIRSKEI